MRILLFCIVCLGLILRLYNLSWGEPFFFHPDERNIASSVSQLQFAEQMNPNFFAYGSFPIYLIYLTGLIINLKSLILNQNIFSVSFDQAILISRFLSTSLSVFIIPLIYLIGKKLKDKQTGIIASLLTILSVGFIQSAHFGTFETWLTFFGLLLFYFCLKIVQTKSIRFILLAAITLGILVSIKVSSLALLPIPVLTVFLDSFSKRVKLVSVLSVFIVFLFALITLLITSPFIFLDFPSFLSSMRYESSVALGTLPVFYTGQFFDSTPVVYQFIKIYPFLLNPILTILFIPSLIYLIYKSVKDKRMPYLLLIAFFLSLFFSQAFFFAKWTRYMLPTLPFMYLVISISLSSLFTSEEPFGHLRGVVKRLLGGGIVLISILYAFSYFFTVHTKPDTRIAASLWAKEHIEKDEKILSEVFDMGIVPFNQYLPNITLFNFYDLDVLSTSNGGPERSRRNSSEVEKLKMLLSQSEYIILPSQRILKTRLTNKEEFPQGNKFYSKLFDGSLGFNKIYETPCDLFCKITYMGDPVFSLEETVNVFDRPTVFIFKKLKIE